MATGPNSKFPQQGGTVLVCANGWTLPDDYANARLIFPHAPVIAVNDAAGAVRAFALFSLHPRKMVGWRAEQIKFCGGSGAHTSTHSAGVRHRRTNVGVDPDDHDIDFWWMEALSTGSSGWSARKMARLMGFDRVILCGMPMQKGKYAPHTKGRWNRAWQDQSTVKHYRRGIMEDADWHDGVFSMSGWTREVFGYPHLDRP